MAVRLLAVVLSLFCVLPRGAHAQAVVRNVSANVLNATHARVCANFTRVATGNATTYQRECITCTYPAFINYTNPSCGSSSCNSSVAYDDAYCLANASQSTTVPPPIPPPNVVIVKNNTVELLYIISTFVESNQDYVVWNLVFAFCVIVYVLYVPRLLSAVLSFLINTFVLGPDSDVRIGNLRFAFLGGKVAVHDVTYTTRNTVVRVHRFVFTMQWWNPNVRLRERWVQAQEDQAKQGGHRRHKDARDRAHSNSESDHSSGVAQNVAKDTKDTTDAARGLEESYMLPYRITVDILGLEVMAFNNSQAYDEMERIRKRAEAESRRRSGEASDHPGGDPGLDGESLPHDVDGQEMSSEALQRLFNLPSFYRISPTTKIRIRNANLYAGSENLPTILIVVIQNMVIRHTARLLKEIQSASNRDLDRYRSYTRADMHDVTAILVGNDKYHRKRGDHTDSPEQSANIVFTALRGLWKDTKETVKDVTDIAKENLEDVINREREPEHRRSRGNSLVGNDGDDLVASEPSFHDNEESTFRKPSSAPATPSIHDGLGADDPISASHLHDDQGAHDHGVEMMEMGGVTPAPSGTGRDRKNTDTRRRTIYTRTTGMLSNKHSIDLSKRFEPHIVVCARLTLTYTFDQPGRIPAYEKMNEQTAPPMNKVEVDIGGQQHGLLFTYGAWADRQRSLFMEHFYPTTFQDLGLYTPVQGGWREPTTLQVEVYFHHRATIRVPYRKQNLYNAYGVETATPARRQAVNARTSLPGQNGNSNTDTDVVQKMALSPEVIDEMERGWAGDSSEQGSGVKSGIHSEHGAADSTGTLSGDARQHRSGPLGEASATKMELAWLEIAVSSGSFVTYNMPYYAENHDYGCATDVRVYVKHLEVVSGTAFREEGDQRPFLSTDDFQIKGRLHYPVIYNDPHNWKFAYLFDRATLFFLRQHSKLLTDLSSDWSDSGVYARETYLRDFLPTTYEHTVEAKDTSIVFNVNEKNVIDRFGEMDFNTHVILNVPYLNMALKSLGGLKYQNKTTRMEFSVTFGSINPAPKENSKGQVDPRLSSKYGVESPPKECTVTLRVPRHVLPLQSPVNVKTLARKSRMQPLELTFLSFYSLRVDGNVDTHWEYSAVPRAVDQYEVKFDWQHTSFVCTPESICAVVGFQDNYFGENNYSVTSAEIRKWEGRNLRSRLANRDWVVEVADQGRDTVAADDILDRTTKVVAKRADTNPYHYDFFVNWSDVEIVIPSALHVDDASTNRDYNSEGKTGSLSHGESSDGGVHSSDDRPQRKISRGSGNSRRNEQEYMADTQSSRGRGYDKTVAIRLPDAQLSMRSHAEQLAPMFTDISLTTGAIEILTSNGLKIRSEIAKRHWREQERAQRKFERTDRLRQRRHRRGQRSHGPARHGRFEPSDEDASSGDGGGEGDRCSMAESLFVREDMHALRIDHIIIDQHSLFGTHPDEDAVQVPLKYRVESHVQVGETEGVVCPEDIVVVSDVLANFEHTWRGPSPLSWCGPPLSQVCVQLNALSWGGKKPPPRFLNKMAFVVLYHGDQSFHSPAVPIGVTGSGQGCRWGNPTETWPPIPGVYADQHNRRFWELDGAAKLLLVNRTTCFTINETFENDPITGAVYVVDNLGFCRREAEIVIRIPALGEGPYTAEGNGYPCEGTKDSSLYLQATLDHVPLSGGKPQTQAYRARSVTILPSGRDGSHHNADSSYAAYHFAETARPQIWWGQMRTYFSLVPTLSNESLAFEEEKVRLLEDRLCLRTLSFSLASFQLSLLSKPDSPSANPSSEGFKGGEETETTSLRSGEEKFVLMFPGGLVVDQTTGITAASHTRVSTQLLGGSVEYLKHESHAEYTSLGKLSIPVVTLISADKYPYSDEDISLQQDMLKKFDTHRERAINANICSNEDRGTAASWVREFPRSFNLDDHVDCTAEESKDAVDQEVKRLNQLIQFAEHGTWNKANERNEPFPERIPEALQSPTHENTGQPHIRSLDLGDVHAPLSKPRVARQDTVLLGEKSEGSVDMSDSSAEDESNQSILGTNSKYDTDASWEAEATEEDYDSFESAVQVISESSADDDEFRDADEPSKSVNITVNESWAFFHPDAPAVDEERVPDDAASSTAHDWHAMHSSWRNAASVAVRKTKPKEIPLKRIVEPSEASAKSDDQLHDSIEEAAMGERDFGEHANPVDLPRDSPLEHFEKEYDDHGVSEAHAPHRLGRALRIALMKNCQSLHSSGKEEAAERNSNSGDSNPVAQSPDDEQPAKTFVMVWDHFIVLDLHPSSISGMERFFHEYESAKLSSATVSVMLDDFERAVPFPDPAAYVRYPESDKREAIPDNLPKRTAHTFAERQYVVSGRGLSLTLRRNYGSEKDGNSKMTNVEDASITTTLNDVAWTKLVNVVENQHKDYVHVKSVYTSVHGKQKVLFASSIIDLDSHTSYNSSSSSSGEGVHGLQQSSEFEIGQCKCVVTNDVDLPRIIIGTLTPFEERVLQLQKAVASSKEWRRERVLALGVVLLGKIEVSKKGKRKSFVLDDASFQLGEKEISISYNIGRQRLIGVVRALLEEKGVTTQYLKAAFDKYIDADDMEHFFRRQMKIQYQSRQEWSNALVNTYWGSMKKRGILTTLSSNYNNATERGRSGSTGGTGAVDTKCFHLKLGQDFTVQVVDTVKLYGKSKVDVVLSVSLGTTILRSVVTDKMERSNGGVVRTNTHSITIGTKTVIMNAMDTAAPFVGAFISAVEMRQGDETASSSEVPLSMRVDKETSEIRSNLKASPESTGHLKRLSEVVDEETSSSSSSNALEEYDSSENDSEPSHNRRGQKSHFSTDSSDSEEERPHAAVQRANVLHRRRQGRFAVSPPTAKNDVGLPQKQGRPRGATVHSSVATNEDQFGVDFIDDDAINDKNTGYRPNVHRRKRKPQRSSPGVRSHQRAVTASQALLSMAKDTPFDARRIGPSGMHRRGEPRNTSSRSVLLSRMEQKKRKAGERSSGVVEIVQRKFCAQIDVSSVQIEAIAKNMDPVKISWGDLSYIYGSKGENNKTFNTLKCSSLYAALHHQGVDERNVFVVATPTVQMKDMVMSMTDDASTGDGTLGAMLTVDQCNADLPVDKLNHKRLERTAHQWARAMSHVTTSAEKAVGGGEATPPKRTPGGLISLSFAFNRLTFCSTPISTVFVQVVIGPTNITGHLPFAALQNAGSDGTMRLMIGNSGLTVLTGRGAKEHRRRRAKDGINVHVLPSSSSKQTEPVVGDGIGIKDALHQTFPSLHVHAQLCPGADGVTSARTVNLQFIVPKVEHKFTPEILESFLVLQHRMQEELSMLLDAVERYIEEKKRRREKEVAERERGAGGTMSPFECTWLFRFEGIEITAALDVADDIPPLSLQLNTGGFSLTKKGHRVGNVQFENLKLRFLSGTDAVLGELVTNVRADKQPVNPNQDALDVKILKTGVVFRAGVFLRLQYMYRQYRYHLDRYAKRSRFFQPMVQAVLNVSGTSLGGDDAGASRSKDGTAIPTIAATRMLSRSMSRVGIGPDGEVAIRQVVTFTLLETSVCFCHQLRRVTNDVHDKESGLVITLGSLVIEGQEQEGRRRNRWYGTIDVDALYASFVLGVEDKLEQGSWFNMHHHSKAVCLQVPGVHGILVWDGVRNEGQLRTEFESVRAIFNASMIRLFVSMQTAWSASLEQKQRWRGHGDAEARKYGLHETFETDGILQTRSFEIVLIVAPGQCSVYDHSGAKQLFQLSLPKVHAGGQVEFSHDQIDVMMHANFICTKLQITPELMVFLSELASEIKDMRLDLLKLKQKMNEESRAQAKRAVRRERRNGGRDPREFSDDSSVSDRAERRRRRYNYSSQSSDDNFTDSSEEDAGADDGSNEIDFIFKSVVLLRVTNLQFVVGCMPITEETVMISFNKAIDVIVSSDCVDPEEFHVAQRLSLWSMSVSIPSIRATLQEAYQASNIELTMLDIHAQLNALVGLRHDAPVELAYLDVGSSDMFFSMASMERVHTFLTAWTTILKNANRVMLEEAYHFWGEPAGEGGANSGRQQQSNAGDIRRSNSTGARDYDSSDALVNLSTPTKITCTTFSKVKIKVRKVPLHTLEHTELTVTLRNVEARAMEPGIAHGLRSAVRSYFGNIADVKLSIDPARGRKSSGALEGVVEAGGASFMLLQDFGEGTWLADRDPRRWAAWQTRWMAKKKAVHTFGCALGPLTGQLLLTERSGVATPMFVLDPVTWEFLFTERLSKNDKGYGQNSVEASLSTADSLKLRLSHRTIPFLMKWVMEVVRVYGVSKQQAIRTLNDQGYYEQSYDSHYGQESDAKKAAAGDADLMDYQACGVLSFSIAQLNFIFPAERGFNSRVQTTPYVALYAKQITNRFSQDLDNRGTTVERTLDSKIEIAVIVVGKINDRDGSMRDEKDVVVFPRTIIQFCTKHEVPRSIARGYRGGERGGRERRGKGLTDQMKVYYTFSALFRESGSDEDRPGAIKVSNDFDDYHILTRTQECYAKWYSEAAGDTRATGVGGRSIGRRDARLRRENVTRILVLDKEEKMFEVAVAFEFAPKLKLVGLEGYEIPLATYLNKFTTVERQPDTGEIVAIGRAMDEYVVGFFKRAMVGMVVFLNEIDSSNTPNGGRGDRGNGDGKSRAEDVDGDRRKNEGREWDGSRSRQDRGGGRDSQRYRNHAGKNNYL